MVCTSSLALLDSVFKVGDNELKISYERELGRNPTTCFSVDVSGRIRSKKIYFVPWQPTSDVTSLVQSLKTVVSIAMEKASNENFHSIAFPAIGYNQITGSVTYIAQALVEEAYRLLDILNIDVFFIIQPQKTNIYNDFQNQIISLNNLMQSADRQSQSFPVGNSKIIVEKGSITTQKVKN